MAATACSSTCGWPGTASAGTCARCSTPRHLGCERSPGPTPRGWYPPSAPVHQACSPTGLSSGSAWTRTATLRAGASVRQAAQRLRRAVPLSARRVVGRRMGAGQMARMERRAAQATHAAATGVRAGQVPRRLLTTTALAPRTLGCPAGSEGQRPLPRRLPRAGQREQWQAAHGRECRRILAQRGPACPTGKPRQPAPCRVNRVTVQAPSWCTRKPLQLKQRRSGTSSAWTIMRTPFNWKRPVPPAPPKFPRQPQQLRRHRATTPSCCATCCQAPSRGSSQSPRVQLR
mmetsp:Transcript_12617/g.48427  ORF Transcript_12617/g.48427 Transcript_12617/m.48427 type:complete len:288 (-) Transcript_12617:337-1200(-)